MQLTEKKSQSPELCRIDDNRYLYQSVKDCPVIVSVNGIYNDGNLSYRVALQASRILSEGKDLSQDFIIGGRAWKIYQKAEKGGRLLSLVNRIQKVFTDTHAKEFEVSENSYFGSWFSGDKKIEDVSLCLSNYFHICGIDGNKVPLLQEPYSAGPFTDPFTVLATTAYQKYESYYRNKDSFCPKDCDTRIIFNKNKFSLVYSNDPLAKDEKIVKQTLEIFLMFIKRKFGKEKISEIDFRYNLNFDELLKSNIGLTPEHVYRVNIGVNYIEMKNINDTWNSLVKLYYQPNTVHHKVPIDSYFEALPESFLTGRVKRSIYMLLKKRNCRDPTLDDLINWLHKLVYKKSFEELSLKSLNTIINLLMPDQESYERSLTGRKIYGFIRSYYTNADYGDYKPWVDQQELYQTIVTLKNQESRDLFLEKLSHVVVKKHLARLLPDGNFRVGAIIPAPLDAEEKQNWYKVTSCVSIPQGVHSYTLESVLAHYPLDKIKLYRSTSHNGYALRSAASVLNDLNSLNSPGYEGKGLADSYELSFFQESTIPLWVAYAILAKKHLMEMTISDASEKDAAKLFQYLKRANASLIDLSTKEHEQRNLRQIIRKHDAILNELYRLSWKIWGSFSSYTSLHEFLSAKFESDEEKEKQEEKLASALFNQLNLLSREEKDHQRKWAIVKLKDELFRHVIFYCENAHLEKIKETRKKYHHILKFEDEYSHIDNLDKRIAHLYFWQEMLLEFGKQQLESVECKKPLNIILAGHSLGGACAQLNIIHFYLDQDRIPLPGYECLGYFLDDPAINDDDNERFKSWGRKHEELFQKLDVKFTLKRRQEAGDIVPLGGEVHLGATFSEEEDKQLKQSFRYDFRLRERMKNAKNLAIALSACAHETQFEEGTLYDSDKEEGDYRETIYSSVTQGMFDKRHKISTVYDKEHKIFVRKEFEQQEQQEKWDAIREKWKLASLYSTFEGEWFRTHRYCSLFYYLLMGYDSDSRISESTDDKGVFAVDEKGVISKKLTTPSEPSLEPD